MKNIIFCLLLLLLGGCTPSREKRSEVLVRETMNKIVRNIDSYEPVATKIDSAYTSVYTDMNVIRAVYDLIEFNEEDEREWLRVKYNSAKSSAAIWRDMGSVYSKERYRQAQEEINECAAKIEEFNNEETAKIDAIRACAKNVVEGQFCGWNIYHKFRCANGLGIKNIADVLIIADEDIETVQNCFVLDDDDEYSLGNIKKIVDKVLK